MSESNLAGLTMGKMVCTPGAWSKRVVHILLMSNGCVLGVTCNQSETLSPYPLKASCAHAMADSLFTWQHL